MALNGIVGLTHGDKLTSFSCSLADDDRHLPFGEDVGVGIFKILEAVTTFGLTLRVRFFERGFPPGFLGTPEDRTRFHRLSPFTSVLYHVMNFGNNPILSAVASV